MSAAARIPALAAYRRLLRAERKAFAGDLTTLTAAQLETRKQFLAAASVTAESERAELLQKAHDVAVYLERNIVQAVKSDNDVYKIQIDPTRHEINDNMDVKKPYTPGKRIPCCGPGSEVLPRC
ncbi:hypothetical protein AMAG_08391 [Allomyces macrogynus ATCC 38327]|uniref:Mitochondrial zinc maintenance protein 1, mitochondrial n=1 Tax=Allomyces macrogynus (strain ATCC 38327) TaxID=578462 RepID=A0A0L0SLI3_ALLM3|nr:hypothetical protein AMAG_08391 [Allomyces macrogynus ATCC 38327]|eukprot:KNE63244.1 hypothetical protein AMAG_08391 [Allomyces macrogynus ATCC 38327]